MKSRWMLAPCLLALMSVPALAQEEKPPAGMPDMNSPEMQAAMQAMAPGEEHKRLSRMAGDWTFTSKMYMAPGAPPMEWGGTMHGEMILGGRYLEAVWKGNIMGQAFEGHALEGYDNMTKKHVSTWVDNMATGIMYSTGTCDSGGKVCTSTSPESMDPMTGKMTATRMVVTWVDDKNFNMEMYMKPAGGAETKSMEMAVTRK